MKKILLLFFTHTLLFSLYSQAGLDRYYYYDNAGNRILRSVIQIPGTKSTVSTETDSTHFVLYYEFDSLHFTDQMGDILLRAYPNPVTKILHVTIGNYSELPTGTLTLYNINGQLLQNHVVSSAHHDVDFSSYASGIYILKLSLNGNRKEWKIIKE